MRRGMRIGNSNSPMMLRKLQIASQLLVRGYRVREVAAGLGFSSTSVLGYQLTIHGLPTTRVLPPFTIAADLDGLPYVANKWEIDAALHKYDGVPMSNE